MPEKLPRLDRPLMSDRLPAPGIPLAPDRLSVPVIPPMPGTPEDLPVILEFPFMPDTLDEDPAIPPMPDPPDCGADIPPTPGVPGFRIPEMPRPAGPPMPVMPPPPDIPLPLRGLTMPAMPPGLDAGGRFVGLSGFGPMPNIPPCWAHAGLEKAARAMPRVISVNHCGTRCIVACLFSSRLTLTAPARSLGATWRGQSDGPRAQPRH